ncbi:MAG: hypothetical protein HY290_03790 [Planctomycetia bacterium]|nr:hypothetical protein [Planctomycetia bacterium]
MAAKQNDGTQLEEIVAQIEGMKLPPGFKVDLRHRVRDDEGIQLAELDVFIVGKVGTSTWTMLIECRDRPSEGRAPRSWIQQLVGRRDDLNLNNVMAVSSTGFARGVAKYAKAKGIELRTFKTLTAEAVSSYFPPTAPAIVRRATYFDARIGLPEAELPADQGKPVRISTDQLCFVDNATQQRFTLQGIFHKLVTDRDECFDGIEIDGGKQKKTIVADEATCHSYTVERDDRSFTMASLEFDSEFWIETSRMPLVHAGAYLSDTGERLADVAKWKGDPTGVLNEIVVVLRRPN